jgi:hypothetical protein
VSWPGGTALSQAAALPISFGNQLELIGYEVRRPLVQPGKNIRLTTYWRAQDRGLDPLSFFVHVLDEQGKPSNNGMGIRMRRATCSLAMSSCRFIYSHDPRSGLPGTRLQLGLDHLTGERVPMHRSMGSR